MSEPNKEAIDLMIEAGALVPMDENRLPEYGWGKVLCGDGDVSPTAVNLYLDMAKRANGAPQCGHLITIDGGPAAVSPKSPFHILTYKGDAVVTMDQYLFARIEGMLILKNSNDEQRVQNMAYEPHCHCGLCAATDVQVPTNMLCTLECKEIVRREFRGHLKHHRIYPFVGFWGYEEEAAHRDGIAYFNLERGRFERLAQQRNWG